MENIVKINILVLSVKIYRWKIIFIKEIKEKKKYNRKSCKKKGNFYTKKGFFRSLCVFFSVC